MLATFGGLLVLMLAAGIDALRVLRELHGEETRARQNLQARGQSLVTLCSSLHVYCDRIQQLILRPGAASADLSRLDAEIDATLKSFPGRRTPEEKALLETLGRLFAEQKAAFRAVASWSREERRKEGPRLLADQVLPGGAEIVETYQRVSVWNSRQFGAADQQMLANFAQLQASLGRLLLVTLIAGVILSLASGVYIARLEHEGRRRYEELARSRGELERLSARLVDAQESERRKISRELHDEVGQSLGAVLVDLGRLSALVPSGSGPMREYLGKIKAATEKTVQTVRDIALLLRPSMLDDLGLVAALEWQGREVSRRSEMEVEVEAENVSEQLPDEYKICVYRLVQEALHNAARHAAAKNARVRVRQDAGRIEIEVRDDGRGFDPARTRGLGILGMEERVRRLGGSLTIDSAPGRGTVLRAQIPLGGGVQA